MNKSENTIDILRELASIGAGNSASSLSKLIGSTVQVAVPQVSVLKLEQVSSHLEHSDQIITATILQITNQLSGYFFMALTPQDAEVLTNAIATDHIINSDRDTVLKELGNILCGTAINALSQFLHIEVSQSIPALTTDMARAITDSVVSELGDIHEDVFLFETDFSVKNINLKIYYLFTPNSTEKIIDLTETHK